MLSSFLLPGLTSPCLAQFIEVAPTVETIPTTPVVDADDPCIWIDPTDPAESTIIGTDKGRGLNVYDLAGREIQHLPHGGINNVDIRYTDSLDVTNFNLGPAFPQGLLVVHDGANKGGDETNFKLVPWQSIAEAVNPKLMIDTSWNPRAER